jgi:hypothetical protein
VRDVAPARSGEVLMPPSCRFGLPRRAGFLSGFPHPFACFHAFLYRLRVHRSFFVRFAAIICRGHESQH